ncbi:hypothetical protein GCM10009557_38920 [Virgisporangium ochraceum]|uniref:Uncharacterized protein n=1 Tax=Virgisporangium ochraceum TaxID=65505 RepID=A0A8J4EJX3_9ACTN|nr:hypothetical protein [Virgisporangium ochraceum]GIJ74787.1 hypothetical protein Voc01_097040 [Virgisporangium ochraceum]
MFGHRASTEPQRLWPCGDVAWANAGPAAITIELDGLALNGLALNGIDLNSSGKYLGTGRRCP